MSKFKVSFTETKPGFVWIEADSKEDAREKFLECDFDEPVEMDDDALETRVTDVEEEDES